MESPITVLWGNIIQTFETIDQSALEMHLKAADSGLLSTSIAYDNSKEKVRTPFASLETRQINLQETYLCHLWSFMYSVFVMYEEGVQKPLMRNRFCGALEFTTPLLQRAKYLFDWSISLTVEHSEWDEKLPNPKYHTFDEEKFYAEKTNALFQQAVALLMFHEFCHLTQGHESFFLGIRASDLDEMAYAERTQIENEADDFAFNMLIKQHDDEALRWIKGLSILLTLCSALLIVSTPRGIIQKTHPDLDQRILTFLQKLDFKAENAQFYCWYLCTVALRLYLLRHNIDTPTEQYETAQEAFFSYLNELDDIKARTVL